MTNQLERLREIIQESLDSHLCWRLYFIKHPEKKDDFNCTAGNPEHHEYCIRKYEEALKLLDELKCLIN